MRVHRLAVASLCVLGGWVLSQGAGASAEVTHRVLAPEAGFGSFNRPTGVAVDQASENILVADGGEELDVVRIFGPEGGAPREGFLTELTGSPAPFGFGRLADRDRGGQYMLPAGVEWRRLHVV